MKFKPMIVAAAVALTFAQAQPVQSQTTQLKVATGSAQGTYSRMLKELNQVCSTQIPIIEVNTGGSMDNMNMLLGNTVNAALVQTDVLYYRARTENLDTVKTLIALHPEEVHFVTLTQSPIREGGVMGVGAKPIQISSLEHLQGRAVAAWGGGYVTAQVIRLQTEVNYTVEDSGDWKTAQEWLSQGRVAAVVMVGGSPMADIEKLDRGYKLISVTEQQQARLKSVYRPARLNYSKMGPGGQGIATVATDAVFVTREYKTDKFVRSLASLRTCALSKLDELKETTGTHPKWQSVTPDNQGKWAWLNLPASK